MPLKIMKSAAYSIRLSSESRWMLHLTVFLTTFSLGTCFTVVSLQRQVLPKRPACQLNMVSSTLTSESPRQLVLQGMQRFRQADIPGSIELFDQAERLDPSLRPFLWQRGISYYYANRFQEGSDQFRYDVRVNPLDVEEILWDIACLSKINPDDVPPAKMMSLPKGKSDRRRIMSTVYSLFRGEATEHDLAVAGQAGSRGDEFYSLFYLGLFTESRGETAKAEQYMRAASKTSYAVGQGAGDYMTSVARVHCYLRNWT